MANDALKIKVAEAAVNELKEGISLGVGSGSTVLCLIDALKKRQMHFEYIVCASIESENAMRAAGYQVNDLNSSNIIDIYVDGADEINHEKCMIKGGGAALTREKIIAASAREFICIADESKRVETLGKFPLPIEVIPMARSYVAREMTKLGGDPIWRQDVVTDNGNWILDIHNFPISQPRVMEEKINNIAGVVTVGIFAQQAAHKVLMSHKNGDVSQW